MSTTVPPAAPDKKPQRQVDAAVDRAVRRFFDALAKDGWVLASTRTALPRDDSLAMALADVDRLEKALATAQESVLECCAEEVAGVLDIQIPDGVPPTEAWERVVQHLQEAMREAESAVCLYHEARADMAAIAGSLATVRDRPAHASIVDSAAWLAGRYREEVGALGELASLRVSESRVRTWQLPPEPGPEVTAVRDGDGDRWERAESTSGTVGWYHQGIGIAKPWRLLCAYYSPLTDVSPTHAEPEAESKAPAVGYSSADGRPFISQDPAMRSGQPCLNHTRLPAESVAGYIWAGEGLAAVMDAYDITKADVIVCCWFMGAYGPKRWRKRWGEWAEGVHAELWHGRFDVPEPPAADDEPTHAEETPVRGTNRQEPK